MELQEKAARIEELEGKFAEFDDFVIQLTQRREEVYAAFESRKVALIEKRNRRAESLAAAADRILKGIDSRVGKMESTDEIAAYFASDLMVDKVRDIMTQLEELEDAHPKLGGDALEREPLRDRVQSLLRRHILRVDGLQRRRR